MNLFLLVVVVRSFVRLSRSLFSFLFLVFLFVVVVVVVAVVVVVCRSLNFDSLENYICDICDAIIISIIGKATNTYTHSHSHTEHTLANESLSGLAVSSLRSRLVTMSARESTNRVARSASDAHACIAIPVGC